MIFYSYVHELICIVEINAKVHLGTVHVKRRITSDAMITLSLRDVQQSYFYSKMSSADLKSILDSYGIHYQIPIVLHGAEISGAGIVSYSNNPRSEYNNRSLTNNRTSILTK